MKKVIKGVGILVLFAFLGAGNPVVAQTTDSTTSRKMNTSHEDRDDTGKWGLLGLLGFLGLLELRKKDEVGVHRTNVNRLPWCVFILKAIDIVITKKVININGF